jgi:hypothetical protein
MGASPLDPESSASTNSATPTDKLRMQRRGFYQLRLPFARYKIAKAFKLTKKELHS